MKGEILPFWKEMWIPIWLKIIKNIDAPFDLSCEMYRSISPFLKDKKTIEEIAGIVSDPEKAFEELKKLDKVHLKDEISTIKYIEGVYVILVEDFELLNLADIYKASVVKFINKYNLKYYISSPFGFSVTISGIFSELISALKSYTEGNAYLKQMTEDFEQALADLRERATEGKIKTCIQKQMNLVEAIASMNPNMNSSTFGKMCDELKRDNTWPHIKLKDSITSLYAFASDYPGVRHGGHPQNALRPLNMNDLIAVTIATIGFIPYLCREIDTKAIIQK